MTLLYCVISLYIFLSAPIFAQSAPPLVGAIPRAANDRYCKSGFDQCTAIGEPGFCCSSGARCVFDYGGGVACCDFSITCDGEVSGATSALSSIASSSTSPTLEAAATGFVSVTTVDGASRTEIVMMTTPSGCATAFTNFEQRKWRRYMGVICSVLACFVP